MRLFPHRAREENSAVEGEQLFSLQKCYNEFYFIYLFIMKSKAFRNGKVGTEEDKLFHTVN